MTVNRPACAGVATVCKASVPGPDLRAHHASAKDPGPVDERRHFLKQKTRSSHPEKYLKWSSPYSLGHFFTNLTDGKKNGEKWGGGEQEGGWGHPLPQLLIFCIPSQFRSLRVSFWKRLFRKLGNCFGMLFFLHLQKRSDT